MVLSTYSKQRILYYYRNGLRPSQILSALRVEGIISCRQTVSRFILRFLARGTISRKEGSGRPSVITDRVLQLVEQAMKSDDETTATQLHVLLTSCEIHISFSTILRSRSMLGWTFHGSKYCQLIKPSVCSGQSLIYLSFLLVDLKTSSGQMRHQFSWRVIGGIHTARKGNQLFLNLAQSTQ